MMVQLDWDSQNFLKSSNFFCEEPLHSNKHTTTYTSEFANCLSLNTFYSLSFPSQPNIYIKITTKTSYNSRLEMYMHINVRILEYKIYAVIVYGRLF